QGRRCVGCDVNMKYLVWGALLEIPEVSVDLSLPFPDRSFDTVILLEVIEHLPEIERILKEAFRVARRNVLITVPNSESLELLQQNDVTYGHMLSSDHVHFFDPRSLKTVLERFTNSVEIRRG